MLKKSLNSPVRSPAIITSLIVTVFTGCSLFLVGCATDQNFLKEAPSTVADNSAGWQKIPDNYGEDVLLKYFGFVDVTRDEEGESQYFEAGFAQFQQTAPIGVLLESFRQADADSCDYRQRTSADSQPLEFKDELDLDGFPYEFVSAGSKVEIVSGNHLYAKLIRTSNNPEDAVQYETDVGSLPLSFGGMKFGDVLVRTVGLRASSTGDVFPAFSSIEIPAVDPLIKFKPGPAGRIEADTVFRWRTGKYSDDPGVRVQIEGGGGGRAIFCAVTDDGTFELPEEVKSQLGEKHIINPSGYRDVIGFYVKGDALLIVSQSSYY